ncbi:MAG TPA: DUF1566 domain-containing protein [Sedimentisphaerales bacterium]|nr:DUF1566 domain-containing protein [Sedimentisphaerales bacterium]
MRAVSVSVLLAALVLLATPLALAGEDQAKAAAPVVKTGATKSYSEGDDGSFLMGVAWPTPRFAVDEAAGTVTDNLTGLMWPKNLNIAGKNLSWADALAFCKQLDLGNHNDWRLANVRELQSLNEWAEQSTILPKDHPFTGVPVLAAWASTTFALDTNIAWYVRTDAYMGHAAKTEQFSVLPVRGGVAKDGTVITKGIAPVAKTGQTKSYAPGDDGDLQMGVPWPNPRFTVDGDCVTDNLTGLMWAKNGDIAGGGKVISCYEAIDLCKNLDLGGHKDWRLPNIKELQSLTDYSSGLPGEPFTDVVRAEGMVGYWSGTVYPKTTPHTAWLVGGQGYTTGNAMDGSRYKHRVWPVRGGEVANAGK